MELKLPLRESTEAFEIIDAEGKIVVNSYGMNIEEFNKVAPLVIKAFNTQGQLVTALRTIVRNDPFNQSSAGIIAREALAAVGAA